MSLSNKALVLAEQSVHPVPQGFSKPGINYREWLIGQALAGFCAHRMAFNVNPSLLAQNAIDVAEAVLNRLAADEPPKGSYTEG